jgi:hypothetical protein
MESNVAMVSKTTAIHRTETNADEKSTAVSIQTVALMQTPASAPEDNKMEIAPSPVEQTGSHSAEPATENMASPSVEQNTATTPVVATENNTVTDNKFANPSNVRTEAGADSYSWFSIFERADQLKAFAKKNGYNTRYAFLADMGMKSGKKRFFLIDLETFQILKSGLVAHGKGNEDFATDKKYSNEIGSKCTSLGLYRIGQSFTGEFGTAFKLHGLSQSNNNAMKRAIVLHSMNGIPDEETATPIAQTEGCPSLSPGFLKSVIPIIENNPKAILLWLFDAGTEQVLSSK